VARTPINLEPLDAIVAAAVRGELDEPRARQLYTRGAEAVTFVLMAMARRLSEQDTRLAALQSPRSDTPVTPSTPSGMIPAYAKPASSPRRKKPGAKNGHPGARRATPQRIDLRESHRLKRCPDCGGTLQRCTRSRTRIIEDIHPHTACEANDRRVHPSLDAQEPPAYALSLFCIRHSSFPTDRSLRARGSYTHSTEARANEFAHATRRIRAKSIFALPFVAQCLSALVPFISLAFSILHSQFAISYSAFAILHSTFCSITCRLD